MFTSALEFLFRYSSACICSCKVSISFLTVSGHLAYPFPFKIRKIQLRFELFQVRFEMRIEIFEFIFKRVEPRFE